MFILQRRYQRIESSMKLLIQPDDGISPLVNAIGRAKKSIEMIIFRCDQRDVERALAAAVNRGVAVHGLIAHTNHGGEAQLRKLELRLLGAGVMVARTADDLARYHGKMMLIDRRELFLLAFNLTHQDIGRSRSFGLITRKRDLVREAGRLFDADVMRYPFEPSGHQFVVSPVNARKELASFLKAAKKELSIYDPEVSDPVMIDILEERARAGVEIRILGRLTRNSSRIQSRKLAIRLHTRTIIRDGNAAFIGSQSLRKAELDARREIGVVFKDARVINQLQRVFAEDWEREEAPDLGEPAAPARLAKLARRVAKTVAQELPPVASIAGEAVRDAVETVPVLDPDEIETAIQDAVKGAVRAAVEEAVVDVVEQNGRAKE
jgi:cardiolipin synthase A/B